MTSWTDEKYDRMRALIGEGCSASTVALMLNKEFGDFVSRNAVIGKAHRTKIEFTSLRGGQNGSHQPRKITHTPAPERSGRMIFNKSAPPNGHAHHPPSMPMPVMGSEAAAARPVTLFELTLFTCRWPLGDTMEPATLFCGAGCRAEHPYCAAHLRKAYQIQPKRRVA